MMFEGPKEIGTLDFSRGGDSGPSPPDALTAEMNRLIIGSISGRTGVSEDDVVADIINQLNFDIKISEARNLVVEHIEGLIRDYEIVRVSFIAENIKNVAYFPKGTTFVIEPRQELESSGETPLSLLRPISASESHFVESAINNLTWASEHLNPDVVVRIVDVFCHRCGRVRVGHYCPY